MVGRDSVEPILLRFPTKAKLGLDGVSPHHGWQKRKDFSIKLMGFMGKEHSFPRQELPMVSQGFQCKIRLVLGAKTRIKDQPQSA